MKELEATEETLAHLVCGNCGHYFEEHYESENCLHDEHLKLAVDKYLYKPCWCKKFVIPEIVIFEERKEAA